jgi:hypothetical protein
MRRPDREVEPDRVTIQFGPEVRRRLAYLQETVRGKEGFDNDAFALLEHLNSGAPIEIEDALTNLAMVVRASVQYQSRTADAESGRALNEVIGHLMGQSRDAKPISVFVEPRVRTR